MVSVCVCVSHDILRFNTMVKAAAVRNWDQTIIVSFYLSVRLSVSPSIHPSFPLVTARSLWGQQGGGQHGGGMGGEGPGEGELDGCIMHRIHTSL
jgi:hypothetical protein